MTDLRELALKRPLPPGGSVAPYPECDVFLLGRTRDEA